MSYMDLARSRYSCRSFEDRSVEQAVVDAIVEAGRIAPSACNNHPTRVMVLDTPELLEKAAACQPRFARDGSIFGAPLIFLICSVTDDAWVRPYDQMNSSAIDTSIVCDQMMMEAEEQGLGTCWVCHFKPELARGRLSLSHARLRLSCRPHRRSRASRGPYHSPLRLPPQVVLAHALKSTFYRSPFRRVLPYRTQSSAFCFPTRMQPQKRSPQVRAPLKGTRL